MFVQQISPAGRPKKNAIWRSADRQFRDAFAGMICMTEKRRKEVLESPHVTVAQRLANIYISRYPAEAVARLLPGAWQEDNEDEINTVDMSTNSKLTDLENPDYTANA